MAKTALDAADIRILSALQQHGQLSKSKLAELVNLSSTASWARLDKLKKSGLIRAYRADIALDKIADVTKVVVTVSLANHRKQDFDRFEKHIQEIDQIIQCIATGGGTDYVMTVVTQNLSSFQTLIDSLLDSELGIDRYMTYIVTREVKSSVPNLTKLLSNQEE